MRAWLKDMREGIRLLPGLAAFTVRSLRDGSHPWCIAVKQFVEDAERRHG